MEISLIKKNWICGMMNHRLTTVIQETATVRIGSKKSDDAWKWLHGSAHLWWCKK